MAIKAFGIHGHFYQPPREDPLTGVIPDEPGAAPYKNWNERILHECYQPNARLKNFSGISFNVGPTLLSWLQNQDLNTYQQILNQDHVNHKRYGLGNAIAQTYNHTILPLASSSDKNIQISWGIADYEYHFGHRPQGMWLPEAAVDYETLSLMSRKGIEFTVLAPWQANLDHVDTNEPYRVNLPGERSIAVFFYHGDLSTRISFEPKATEDAELFANNELDSYYSTKDWRSNQDQFILLASDGELYGHHQPLREHFLSQLLNGAGDSAGLFRAYPALWLKTHPPRKTIRVREGTSWSCHHGITRWSGDCACTSIDGQWKSHLRYALNRLASSLDSLYYDTIYPLIPKPRILRQQYIHVMLGEIQPQRLISEMESHPLTNDQIWRIYLLLESQRERQRIYTSCGWFFEDFDRIEPKNVIAYAAHAVRLARLATGDDLSTQTASDLKQVISPITGLRADRVFNEQLSRSWSSEDHLSISGSA